MLIVRETFTAKPGQAGKMAKLFKKTMPKEAATRVMTDLVGCYNTVCMEMEVESLAAWEKTIEEYKSGKWAADLSPEDAAAMKGYTDMWIKGKREVFQVVE